MLILYGNSINNEYSIDDNDVVDGIEKVEGGFKSIPKLFTQYYISDGEQQFSYRPIVSVSFALEKQFFKNLPRSQTVNEKKGNDKITQANISHFINLLLYIIAGISLLHFLQLLLINHNALLPILITFLFLIHPSHTEAVANIKSRDELLMFIGVIAALSNFVKYVDSKQIKYLIFGILFTLFSFLSKKTGFVIIGFLPVILYFRNISFKSIIILFGITILLLLTFIGIKKGLINEKSFAYHYHFENPLYGPHTFQDRFLLAISSAWFYFKMLIIPHNFSFYYGYNQIEVANWTSFKTYATLLIYASIGIFGLKSLFEKKIIGLGIALWFGATFGFLNIVSIIPGIVADRFLLIMSFGYSIVLAIVILKILGIENNQYEFLLKLPKKLTIVLLFIFLISAYSIIDRNKDWENYLTLFYNDIEHLQNSAKANSILGDYLWKELEKETNNQKKAILASKVSKYYERAHSIYPDYYEPLNNLGSLYFSFTKDLEKAKEYFNKALRIKPNSIVSQFNLTRCEDELNNLTKAEQGYKSLISQTIQYNSDLAIQSYSYLSLVYIRQKNYKKAIESYKDGIKHFPMITEFPFRLGNLLMLEKDVTSALYYYEKVHYLDPSNTKIINILTRLNSEQGNVEKSAYYRNLLSK
ncbi:MAG: tetratricopeptide (TPR) repeat protein [Saprospiraceae bacterium]|jgi:tetratricopeptide (TPR) repeat protein